MTNASSLERLDLNTVVRASPQQISCGVADEAVLLSMRDGEYYGLNEVAASIWKHVQQPRTLLAAEEEAEPVEAELGKCHGGIAAAEADAQTSDRRDSHRIGRRGQGHALTHKYHHGHQGHHDIHLE